MIAAKRVNLTIEEARELAKRALKFKQERGRLPVDHVARRLGEAHGRGRGLPALA